MQVKVFHSFDVLRIVAASLVVFSHSFIIAEGVETNEPAQRLVGEILGIYGVFIFFMLSGFMVSDSAVRTGDLLRFAIKRAARIVPLFVICNVFVLAFVCPPFADQGAISLLSHRSAWSELAKVLTFRTDVFYLPQVSFYAPMEGDPYLQHVANGVLWTIRLELTCYIFVAVLWASGVLERAGGAIAIATIVLLLYLATRTDNGFVQGLALCAPSFAAGMVMRDLAKRHRPTSGPAFVCVAALVLLALGWRYLGAAPPWDRVGAVIFPLLMLYPLLYLGLLEWPWLKRVRSFGDPSYGVYLWGWPIQQVLRSIIGAGWSGYGFAALCLPIALGVGYISWFVVERPVLSRARELRRIPADGARVGEV
jgi:peptidoglycan/LPS O-acetylase OafA/YrhL